MRNIQKLFPITLVFICIISTSAISLAREIIVDKNYDSSFELTYGSQKQLPPLVSFNNTITAQKTPSEDKVLPEANFITNVTTGYIPFSVQFATLLENATEWRWDFGDGSNSIEQNPIHTYRTPGTYNVNLTVSNPNGSASKQENIIALKNAVPVLPVANFIANVTSGNVPLSAQFADLSQNVTQRSWNFGDGVISTDENPAHEYSKAGYYIASLTVYNENGTSTKTLGITVQEIPIYPVANFTVNVTSGYAPLSVLFTDTSHNATSNSWILDTDGLVYSNYSNKVYTYIAPGTYNVTLTAINVNGTNSTTSEITVYEVPIENKVLPVADFSTNITSGYAPLSVLFTDLSQNETSRTWDFDSDGIADSSDTNPIYTYTTPGTYIANLTVGNENGSASKTATISVLDGSSSGGSSSGSSGSGGGRGAGGSPELQSNVEAKEFSQTFIANGSPVKFDFPQKVTPVVYVSFDSKKTVGKTITIVEMLKGKSTLVSGLPSNEVYKFVNTWVGNSGFATPKNIENAVLCFKVEKSWVQDKEINKSTITLNWYSDNKWNQLPTILSSEDDKYLYLTARTSGFSYFTITGKRTATETIQPATGDKAQNSTVSGRLL